MEFMEIFGLTSGKTIAARRLQTCDRGITGFTRLFQHTFYEKRPCTVLKFECVRVPFWTFFRRSDVFEVSGGAKYTHDGDLNRSQY